MPLYPLAAATALLPQLAIIASYLWAASLGHVDWCLPHLHSCTSISATGRQPPESFLFKGLMMPAAVLLAAYWYASVHWLRSRGCAAQRRLQLLLAMGLLGAAGLSLYTLMLGHIGPSYQLQRRIGVVTFFGTTFLGQLLIIHLLGQCRPLPAAARRSQRLLVQCAVVVLLTGLTSVAISALSEALYHRTDDAFEWTFSLLLCLHVLITARLWQQSDFRLQFHSRG
ncbi:hypothetical protein [Spongiibacter sp.]|uniref:hypothetical protein n=1 Tax=Spongiibacter sp. TaxID=2024860 RepID=UPI0035649D06